MSPMGSVSAARRWWTCVGPVRAADAANGHINRDFRLNSQALAACVTAEECIGGRAWPSFALENAAWERDRQNRWGCVAALVAWRRVPPPVVPRRHV